MSGGFLPFNSVRSGDGGSVDGPGGTLTDLGLVGDPSCFSGLCKPPFTPHSPSVGPTGPFSTDPRDSGRDGRDREVGEQGW